MRSAIVAMIVAAAGWTSAWQGAPQAPTAVALGVVSNAHPLATAARERVLREGGNAWDAAVTVAAAFNVVEPGMSGLGGYGTVMTYHAASGRARFLNTSGRTPAGVNSDAYRAPTLASGRTAARRLSVTFENSRKCWRTVPCVPPGL